MVSDGPVYALTEFDDGGGAALYAGGWFATVGGVMTNAIAQWDGASWTPLGSGITHFGGNAAVWALTAFDDGSGSALYAGGFFSSAGGAAADNIARWDGSSWTPLGSGVNRDVLALVAFDDGGGAALYAGGLFSTAGSMAANRIAKWDGSSWTPLGGGLNDGARALAVFDDGGGEALYAGGVFVSAFDSGDSYLARWGCDSPTCASFCSSLPNATGSPAELTCSGEPGSSLTLTSAPVPDTTGQFLFGPTMLQGSPFGDGLRCVGGTPRPLTPFVHAGMMMQPPNTATFVIDYAAPYASGLVGTQYFQHWFRSGLATGSGFNTSNGLAVTF